MTSPRTRRRRFFYPNTDYQRWADDVRDTMRALHEDLQYHQLEIDREALAIVAALLVVADRVDAVAAVR